MEHTALELIDKLIACWNNWDSNEEYYLNVLASSIVRSDGSEHLMNNEQEIVAALRHLLSEAEWQQLPTLIAQRRANNLNELASDRERAEARRESKRREDQERARRKEAEEAQIGRKRALVARLKALFESDYLSADGVLAVDPDAELVTGEEYGKLKIEFVQDWTSRNLGQPLDSEQASAVAASGGDIQVVARAGSGKTEQSSCRSIVGFPLTRSSC